MSLALDAILSDTNSQLEIAIEIDSAHRVTGASKTWYFSTHPRGTGSGETPANTEFLPFIQMGGTLGPLSQSLSEDNLFASLAEINPGSLTLIEKTVDTYELLSLDQYVFAGYPARIKIGRVTDLYASFTRFATLSISIDPVLQNTSNGFSAQFSLASPLKRMLEQVLLRKNHLGISRCLRFLTSAGFATVTKVAAHDVKNFTIGVKFRAFSIPAIRRRIMAKVVSTTDTHFFFALEVSGKITLTSTSNLAADIAFVSPTNLCDGSFHSLVFGRDNNSVAYVMIDNGSETIYTPLGSTDLSNTNIVFGLSNGNDDMDICDARFLNRYMPPDEARGYFLTRASGDDTNVIGLWPFDDNAGSTANDESSVGADAAIAGVINTAFQWTHADLGPSGLSGVSYPVLEGNILNAKAELIDTFSNRYRGNNDADGWHTDVSNTTLTVRSQGTILSGGGVDYTAPNDGGDGVFSMTSLEAEPVTFNLLNNGTSEEYTYPAEVAYSLLTERTSLSFFDYNNSNKEAINLLAPWSSGYFADEEATAGAMLRDVLGQSGIFYREDENGSIFFDMLIPPTGYGPYNEPCMDLRGSYYGGYTFGDVGDIAGSCTLCGWVKLNLLDQTAYNFGSLSEPNVGSLYFVAKPDANGNYAVYFQATGSNAGRLSFKIAGTTLRTNANVIQPHIWYFYACVFDSVADTMKIYLCPLGGTLIEAATVSGVVALPTTNSSDLTVGVNGASWFGTQYTQVYNTVKTPVQLAALITTPPVGTETDLVAFVPFNEGLDSPIEKKSLASGVITGQNRLPSWAPKFTVNLYDTPSVKLTDFHYAHPAYEVDIRYAKNRFPMGLADIDTGVSQTDRIFLTRPDRSARYENITVKGRFKNAKKIRLESPITDPESAFKLLRAMIYRNTPYLRVGVLNFPAGLNISRLSCGLALSDEIGVYSPVVRVSGAVIAKSFRVVSVAPNPLQLSNTVAVWG